MLQYLLLAVFSCPATIQGDELPPQRPVTFHPRGDETVSLEGRLRIPEREKPVAGVVICHPDPRYGGRMSDLVVSAVEEALAKAGYATLIFNFRGVGASTGEFDNGRGETEDCIGALHLLHSTEGVCGVAVAGYSFGAAMALQAAVELRLPACACVGLPMPLSGDPVIEAAFRRIGHPTLFVTGAEDEISSLEAIGRLVGEAGVQERCEVREMRGTDHFFGHPGALQIVAGLVVAFMDEHVGDE